MPSVPFRATITGLSSTAGFATWFPDHYANTPFNIGIGVTVNSSNVTYNIEHSFDYLGDRSSNFNGFLSSGATWFQHSTLSGQSSNANGNYAFPVTAIRLNVTAGSSTGTTTVTLIQAFGPDLGEAQLIDTDLTDANVTGCRIFGISAWRLKLEGAKQQNLVITDVLEPEITVDNIEVAQFIYLLLHNQKIRDVIDTITSKAVLILGRFTDERKIVLDALREELRKRDYLPILFDFEKPQSRDTDETITLLARMARFVIADVSDAKAVLQELRGIVPDLSSVPVPTNHPRGTGGARHVRPLPAHAMVFAGPPLRRSGATTC